jgi:hypothetical protein
MFTVVAALKSVVGTVNASTVGSVPVRVRVPDDSVSVPLGVCDTQSPLIVAIVESIQSKIS